MNLLNYDKEKDLISFMSYNGERLTLRYSNKDNSLYFIEYDKEYNIVNKALEKMSLYDVTHFIMQVRGILLDYKDKKFSKNEELPLIYITPRYIIQLDIVDVLGKDRYDTYIVVKDTIKSTKYNTRCKNNYGGLMILEYLVAFIETNIYFQPDDKY